MQHQQEFEHSSNTPEGMPAPLKERQINTDPREQSLSQESTYRSYEEGYTDQSERDYWPFEGEKLQPEPKNQKSMGGLLALIVLLCAVFIAGSLFGAILSWLTWVVVIVLIIAGLAALGSYNFQTGSGGVNLRLPGDAAFSLDAKTNSGGVYNEFGSNEVGNWPHPPLRLRTGSGGIRIHRL